MKQGIKIYLPFAVNELKRNLAYKGAFYLWIFISLFSSFISYFLWMAVYGSSDSAVLGGLDKNEMIVYIFMVYVTSSMTMITISDWVSMDVVKGDVVMQLIKPIDYRLSLVAKAVGSMMYRFFAPGVFVWVGLEVYKVFVLKMEMVSFVQFLAYILSCIMSFLVCVLFDFCFGMVAFFTTYIFGMLMAKEAIMSFLCGQLIPLSFFPEAVQKVFEFMPFSSMVYTPVMIYLGKYQGLELLFELAKQALWVVILYAAGSLIWKQVTKRLVVLGG